MGSSGCVNGVTRPAMGRSASIRITPELLSLVAGVDEFKGA